MRHDSTQRSQTLLTPPPEPNRRRSRWLIAGAACVLMVVAGQHFLTQPPPIPSSLAASRMDYGAPSTVTSDPTRPGRSPAPSVATDAATRSSPPRSSPPRSSPPRSSPPERQRVTVTIAADPPHARLYVGNKAMASNPIVLERPRDDSTIHRVSARAPGFETQTLSFVFLKDLELEIELARASRSQKRRRRPRQAARVRTAPTVARRPAKRPRPPARKIIESIDWSTPGASAQKLRPTPYEEEDQP